MRNFFLRFGIAALLGTVVSGLVAAQYSILTVFPIDDETATSSDAAIVEESFDHWFVELSGPPVADGGDPAALRSQKAAFRAGVRAAGISMTERRAFDLLWNGLSVTVPASQLPSLRRMAGVTAIYPVLRVELEDDPADPGSTPQLVTALAMTGADIARSQLGLTGAGIKVAVMDTGIDYHHPDLGGCFGPSCRVEKGWDFVGNTFNPDTGNTTPIPDADPDDPCNGHGTHVAGIVGANGALMGAAPGVTFYAYKVFGCGGPTFSDIMLAAMEQTYVDGADILSMSIGSARQWPAYPTAQGSDRLVRKGIVVVAAAGNDASQGVYGSAAPGVGSKVISVASVNNTHQNFFAFTASGGGLFAYQGAVGGTILPPVSGSAPMARTGTTSAANDACNAVAPAPGSLAGQMALIRRGGCTFHEKVVNAQNAGAAGVVVYNNTTGTILPNIAGPTVITIPVVSITAADGATLDGRIAAGPTTMTWTSQQVSFPISTGGLIATSSSYGPSPDLALKPDIAAPGGTIESTYPIELGGYARLGGTSMATPHVSGAVALLLQARPNTPPALVRTLLQNSADPFIKATTPPAGFLENVHRQGAGLLDVDDAILSSVKIEPSKLSLGESEAGPATRTLTFTNAGQEDVTFALSHAAALATTGTYSISFTSAPATVTFSSSSLTVPAGGAATVDVTIAPAEGLADRSMYGGYVVATASTGTYRVPYAGFKGDYQSIPVLVPTANGFPWLARLTGTSYVKQTDGATFTMAGGDVPFILAHFDHQVNLLRMEVFDAVTGKTWHRFVNDDYFTRNSGAATFFSFAFDGTTFSGQKVYTVPDGQYVVRLSVLKALGDSGNPAHWETWTTPSFIIDRP